MTNYIPNSLKAKVIDFWNLSNTLSDEIYTIGRYEIPEDEKWLNQLMSGRTVAIKKPSSRHPDIFISCEETDDAYHLWVERVVFPSITADAYDYADSVESLVGNEFVHGAKVCTFINQYTIWKD